MKNKIKIKNISFNELKINIACYISVNIERNIIHNKENDFITVEISLMDSILNGEFKKLNKNSLTVFFNNLKNNLLKMDMLEALFKEKFGNKFKSHCLLSIDNNYILSSSGDCFYIGD